MRIQYECKGKAKITRSPATATTRTRRMILRIDSTRAVCLSPHPSIIDYVHSKLMPVILLSMITPFSGGLTGEQLETLSVLLCSLASQLSPQSDMADSKNNLQTNHMAIVLGIGLGVVLLIVLSLL